MDKKAEREGVMTEADTCREFVTPRLVDAGWSVGPHAIGEQRTFTNGRIIVAGGRVRRGKQKPFTSAAAKKSTRELIASMRSSELEVMRLLGEIEALVSEVEP